ncbi:DUF2937 family protein [Pseudomonas sp. 148P]|uniref:DUF2937 family protein n=1 Tax=Pseudomonas ulcerans TaxID=3115852 RepID=A0ABU7HYG7_9PSED|nr:MULTISPECIES: DUF2937 family protein [unclassified Pseudomonas]MEE1924890.1 DUF2937 family protein [Pseudomonas sp. 147P]MEE1936451.1 DUF2937 family protein [Pseudomonas sp. 148P]
MLRSYLRLILFTCGLLLGIQVPGLVNDYSQRVQAHLLESREGLKGFQQTAQRFFNGDLDALVRHYRASDDPVFLSDANSIDSLVIRNRLLESEWQALQTGWAGRTWHVLTQPEPAIREETLKGYSYQILLTPEAATWGLGCALLFALVVESLLLLVGWVIMGGRRKAVQPSWR